MRSYEALYTLLHLCLVLQVSSRPAGAGSTVQRIILPAAPNQVSIRPAPPTTGAQVIRTTLAAGAGTIQQINAAGGTFLQAGGSTPQGVQGYALVPASYLSQVFNDLSSVCFFKC